MNKFQIKDKVEHILSGDWMLVLQVGKEQYLCRTKDMREIWCYEWELKPVK